MNTEPKKKYNHHVKFKDLPIGATFYCWGDYHAGYNYPKWVEAIKDSNYAGNEIPNGCRFCMSDEDHVSVEI